MDPKHIWVCGACGKTNPKGRWAMAGMMGWDESCAMNATLCLADSLKLRENGRVSYADPVPEDVEKAQRKAEAKEMAVNVGEANRVRACLDCGEPGALLWRTTKGENAGRLLRICAACLRKDDWHRFGLVERQPILGEVPTELVNGEWCFPQAEGPVPAAVITYTDEPSPETGDVGWCWWACGGMGCAPTYDDARQAAEAEIKRRIRNRMAVM